MGTLTVATDRKALVLLVVPDGDNRVSYADSLRLAAFDVDEATDGREALVRAAARTPRIIVTETGLPFIDGYALCALFRNDPPTRNTALIVLTADARPAQVDRARHSGADAVLVKPCLPEQLLAAIERLPATGPQASEVLQPGLAARLERSAGLLAFSREKRRTYVRVHQRFETTTPALQPPELWCPSCGLLLTYERSHIGGVSGRFSEQWDYYSCAARCGTFQYRQRTRKLRPAG
jgi:CheY-like chemotaxis protein